MIDPSLIRLDRGYSRISVIDGLFVEASDLPTGFFLFNRRGDVIIGNPAREAGGERWVYGEIQTPLGC